jgi:hypothetical protein
MSSRLIILTDTGIDAQNSDSPSGQLHALLANMIVEKTSSVTIESLKSRIDVDLSNETVAADELRGDIEHHEYELARLRIELAKTDKTIECWKEIVKNSNAMIETAIRNGTIKVVE